MSNILGIDLSLTGTGLALLYPPEASIHDLGGFPNACFRGQGSDRSWTSLITTDTSKPISDRWNTITSQIRTWAMGAELVVIEGYSYGSPAGMRACIELGGIIRYLLAAELREVVEISPSTLKKFVCGAGNAEKNQMLLQTYKRWGCEFGNDNECDAYGLAKIGQALRMGTDGLTKGQIDIIEQLKASPRPKKKRKEKQQ